jgi:glycosyltransferase involved in cell wall biosynthesis
MRRMKDVVDAALTIPDAEVGWLAPAIAAGVAACRASAPDVIYASAPPWTGQLVAGALAGIFRRPWVADFRDPWARAPWREDRFRFAIGAARVLERAVVSRCDRIVFVAGGNRDDFARSYGAAAAARFDLVPNGCDPAEFDALGPQPLAEPDRFVLLHAGSLYGGRRMPPSLIDAVTAAIARGAIDPATFRLRFLGAQPPADAAALRDLGGVVEFRPRVAREESLRAMMSASALLLLQPGHTVSVPGKVYEYLAAGRPILAIAEEGEIATLIRDCGAGVSIAPREREPLIDALARMTRQRDVRVSPAREYYDGTVGAARIADLLEAVVHKSPVLAVECASDACQ